MKNTNIKQSYNPFLPLNEYVPDGEPHVFGDRVYLFGSHDKEGGNQFCELDYVVYSAPVTDLHDWRYEGITYATKQDPAAAGVEAYMYAPDVVRGNDGRYYMYYNLSGGNVDGQSPISVAVCDTPAGKYEYLGYVRNTDGTPFTRFITGDPAIINDNGIIRLYFGWSLHSRLAETSGQVQPEQVPQEITPEIVKEQLIYAQMFLTHKTREEILSEQDGVIMGANTVTLSDDMLTISSNPVRILPGEFTATGTCFEGHAFYEASSIRKINDLYYFIYSSQLGHELCYAISKYADKDFIFKGTIISNGDVGYRGRKEENRLNLTGTNHGSVECINDQWYIFYHRLTHRSDYSRQACAEPILILSDGSIPQVEMTSCGLNGGPLSAEGEYPAVISCNLTNGDMPHITNRKVDFDIPFITYKNNERYITNIKEKTIIGYKYFKFESSVKLTVKTRGVGNGKFVITTGSKELGEVVIAPSEKWNESSTVINITGTEALYLSYHGDGEIDFLSLGFVSAEVL